MFQIRQLGKLEWRGLSVLRSPVAMGVVTATLMAASPSMLSGQHGSVEEVQAERNPG